MNIGDRIRIRREELKMSQDELARKLGYKSRSSINKIEIDGRGLPQSKIIAIAKALETTTGYILGEDENTHTSSILNIKWKKIPLLGTIACGSPILAVENIEDQVNIPEDIHADFALRCKGDSMIDARIHNGDIVYIREQPIVDNGQIAAVLIGDEATLKCFYLSGNTVTLMPCNKKYAPLVYTGEQLNEIRVLGLAIGFTSTDI